MTTFFKWIGILVGVLFLICLLWALGWPYPYYLNNHYRNNFAKQLEELSLPTKSKRLGMPYKGYGNLVGQSNKGVYFASILIKTSQTESELQAFFDTINLSEAESTKKSVEIKVQKIKGLGKKSMNALEEMVQGELVTLPPNWFLISNTHIPVLKKDESLYAVFIIDGPYNSDDFRCH